MWIVYGQGGLSMEKVDIVHGQGRLSMDKGGFSMGNVHLVLGQPLLSIIYNVHLVHGKGGHCPWTRVGCPWTRGLSMVKWGLSMDKRWLSMDNGGCPLG